MGKYRTELLEMDELVFPGPMTIFLSEAGGHVGLYTEHLFSSYREINFLCGGGSDSIDQVFNDT